MKKINMLALLLAVGTLAGCAQLPQGEPTTEPTTEPTAAPLESIEPGVIPTGGVQVTLPEINFSGEVEAPEVVLKNGYSVKIVDSELSYGMVSKVETNFDYETGQVLETPLVTESSSSMKIEDVNAEATIVGLTQADSIDKFGAYVGASAKVSYEMDKEALFNGEVLEASAHLKEGTAYFTLSENLLKIIAANEEVPTKFYLSLPEGLEEELTEETGLILPLLSETNISYIENLLKGMIESELPSEEDMPITDEQSQKLVEIIFTHIITVTKYDTQYLLSVNLTAQNLESVATAVLDDLYNSGLLTELVGSEQPISPSEFEEIKAEMKEGLQEVDDYFSHLKLSVVFDETMVKSVSLDAKFTSVSGGGMAQPIDPESGSKEEIYERYTDTVDVAVKLNVVFEYSDELAITYPDFAGYVEAPMGQEAPEKTPLE